MDNKELTIYDTSLSSLTTLEEFYSEAEINLNTEEGLADAKGIAKKFQKLRTGVENIRKDANAEARAHIKKVDDKAKSIQARIEPLEMRYAEPIKERKRKFENQIQIIDDVVEFCMGKDSAFIAERMEWLETINPYDFAEYRKQCADSLFTAKDQLTVMFSNVLLKEAEAREEAERIKAVEIESRISSIKGFVADAMEWDKGAIEESIKFISGMIIDDETFGERREEAEKVINDTIKKLKKLALMAEPEPEPEQEESQHQLTYSNQDAAMFIDCVANETKNKSNRQETLESLLNFLDGDIELAEKLFLHIQAGYIANVYFKND